MKLRFFITLSIAVLVLGGLFGGYFYLWQFEIAPLIDRFTDTQKSIQALADEGDTYRKKVEPDLEKIADDYQIIRKLFYGSDRILEFIVFIETAAKRNNLSHTIAVAPLGSAPNAQISVTGSYQNVLRFLREIENDAFLIHVETVTLQQSGATSASIAMRLQTP